MEFAGEITGLIAAATEGGDSGGSFLVQPGIGLMIWTLLAFVITMWVLSKFAFPRISQALEERAEKVNSNIDESERLRAEADELLNEYRERLKEAREQADDIVARARKDIEAETRRSLEQIRKEVADLTVLATEKVARKSLSPEDQKRLVEDALNEVDFGALAGDEATGAARN